MHSDMLQCLLKVTVTAVIIMEYKQNSKATCMHVTRRTNHGMDSSFPFLLLTYLLNPVLV